MKDYGRRAASNLIGVSLLVSCASWNGGPASERALPGKPLNSILMTNKAKENRAFTAVGRLEASMVCSGFLVRAGDAQDAPAYFVTSGHCVQDWENLPRSLDEQRDQPVSLAWIVTFHLFRDTPEKVLRVPVKKVLYSSMRNADLAVLELGSTMGAMAEAGVEAMEIVADAPAPGAPIRIVGLPEQGLVPDDQYLRLHNCEQEARFDVIEWYWYWPQLFANHCPDISGGSSGSPLLDAESKVFAIVATSTRRAKTEACSLGNPCVLQEGRAQSQANANYAVSLASLSGCWNRRGVFQSRAPSCALPQASRYRIDGLLPYPTRSRDAAGQPIHWNLAVSGKAQIRLLRGPAGKVNCRDLNSYGPIVSLDGALPDQGPLPSEEGVHLMCLWDVQSRSPRVLITRIDNTPPTRKGKAQVEEFAEGINVYFTQEPPEIASFLVAWGSSKESCKSLEDRAQRRVSVSFETRQLPVKVCFRAEDEAGNAGPWQEQLVGPSKGPQKPRKKS